MGSGKTSPACGMPRRHARKRWLQNTRQQLRRVVGNRPARAPGVGWALELAYSVMEEPSLSVTMGYHSTL